MELSETGDLAGEYIAEFTAGAAVTYYYKCSRKKMANPLDFKLWPGIMRVERMIPRVTPMDWPRHITLVLTPLNWRVGYIQPLNIRLVIVRGKMITPIPRRLNMVLFVPCCVDMCFLIPSCSPVRSIVKGDYYGT